MKADAATQWRLLDLVEIDTRLRQIAHRLTSSPQATAVAEADKSLAALTMDLVEARTAADDVQREVDRAEEAVQVVRDRLARNQARLDSGQGTAKDLQAISHESESLVKRRSDLEDEELEVLERAEGLQAAVTALEQRQQELQAGADRATGELAELTRGLEAERNTLQHNRSDVAGGIGAELLALYDKIGEQVGGTGAAALIARRCQGCMLELNQVDLGRVRAAAEDDVVRCEECRRILVRTAESGL